MNKHNHLGTVRAKLCIEAVCRDAECDASILAEIVRRNPILQEMCEGPDPKGIPLSIALQLVAEQRLQSWHAAHFTKGLPEELPSVEVTRGEFISQLQNSVPAEMTGYASASLHAKLFAIWFNSMAWFGRSTIGTDMLLSPSGGGHQLLEYLSTVLAPQAMNLSQDKRSPRVNTAAKTFRSRNGNNGSAKGEAQQPE